MLVTDGQGVPIGALVHSAQPSEVCLAEATLKTVRVPRRRGRPRTRPHTLVADKGDDSEDFRQSLRRRDFSSASRGAPTRDAEVGSWTSRRIACVG